MQTVCRYPSPLGELLLAAQGDLLTGAWFTEQKYFARTLEADHIEGSAPVLNQAKRWLDVYFTGRDPGPVPPLSPAGTPFQREVWDLLSAIPYGGTATYGALARTLAQRRGFVHFSAQAIGGAVGHNPISLFIPCHRVLGANGSLTGYAGGVDKKRALLALEGVAI